ncbi:putative adenylate cyclase 3 (ATP pyrophosphate-lyase 3) (Adenylyl cyclase 3) [Bradyrhizobium sp. STM 3843]|uniref:adenylate/guanylate cyclase domain-containing protein n=1 Tax=Bradyrhizobium sp. STM 3843 TaxID=551947 RepID=UPI000240AAAA|nr:adenylate/guanylate cyclase domain-containing protein [Bradyrhizobium sp. STM 3843]CCE05513.1 putative adenylate cyclase 3 (ATP pyrophosphate-lyase 3) (Adenylyl cyclase 3) [Bradyrhizobium sp. STM 3843]
MPLLGSAQHEASAPSEVLFRARGDAARTGRRLAAVAFLDIVGYTLLMARDESRTHDRWMKILNEIVRPRTTDYRGRIVKFTGDGLLAEFSSVLDAVEWAQDVQRTVPSAQVDEGEQTPTIALRIAINLGDIIATEFDIFGHGVNVAARLQEHAEPGGVLLSESVYEVVRGTVGKLARDIGYLQLKNVEKPVRAYALTTGVPVAVAPTAAHRERLPSIAVLPLQNLGADPADDYFADGIVEDIIVSLAGLRELFVISRASTIKYRDHPPDPAEVGRALGARYVVFGTVRRSLRLVRVSTQACDSQSGEILWADAVEVAPGELFDLQDEIVRKIVVGIAPNVRKTELREALRKRPDSFTAYDYTLRAIQLINSLDKHIFLQARDFLNRAMAEDPNFAMPVAWAARWHSLYVGQGWSTNPSEDAIRAIEFASRAIELDGQNALALATFGHLKSFLLHEYDGALIYFDRALSACPNHSLAWLLSSATLSYIGDGEQAVSRAEHALRLSPFDQSLFNYYMFLNLAYYAKGDYESAVKWGRMSASENALYTANHRILIAGLAALGRLDEAHEVADRMMKLEPDFRLEFYERTRQPFRHPELRAHYMTHLRLAGLPE